MAFSWVSPIGSEQDGSELDNPLQYVARQPIMDLRGIVHGYELLFRDGPENLFHGDGDQATRTVIDSALLLGVERLTTGLPAFINCSSQALTGGLACMLPPSFSVIEIDCDAEPPSEQLLEACQNLKTAGIRLALDHFQSRPELRPLVELADYVKIDFGSTSAEQRQKLSRMLEGLAVARIAVRIECQPEYRQACKEGFTLFQGYYFCHPTLLKSRRIPANRLSQLAILELLRNDPLDMRELARLLKRDAALTYRLLRLVNSPAYALREQIGSIDAALLVIGEDTFRRVAMLAIASEMAADQPAELLRMAFIRGRFCETSAHHLSLDPTEQYLLGLLSLVPAMLRMPIGMLTPSLPLREEIKEALKGAHNPEHALLHWIESLEAADWETCEQLAGKFEFDQSALIGNYSKAATWTDKILGATT